MKFYYATPLTVLLLTVLCCLFQVRADTFEECKNVTDTKFIASPQSCAGYIFCNDDDSFEGACDAGEYFNELDGVCDDMANVPCNMPNAEPEIIASTMKATAQTIISEAQDNSTTTIATITTMSSNIIAAISTETMPNTATAAAAETPTSSLIQATSSPSIEVTIEVTTKASTAIIINNTTSTTTVVANTEPGTITHLKFCPDVDNPHQIVLLPSERSCSTYYVCFNGSPIEMFCSSMLHFNAQTGQCDHPQNAKCMANFGKPREQCRRHIVDYYPHAGNCNYFYLCQNGFLFLRQCPIFFGWDIEKRTCVMLHKAKCLNNIASLN